MFLAITLLFSAAGYAQLGLSTNPAPTFSTNAVVAAASYRVVTGQLYNIERSVLWSNLIPNYVQSVPDGILVQPFQLRPIYTNYTTPGGPVGKFFFGGGGQTKVGDEKTLSRPIVLRNYPASVGLQPPDAGQIVRVRAMKIGTSAL